MIRVPDTLARERFWTLLRKAVRGAWTEANRKLKGAPYRTPEHWLSKVFPTGGSFGKDFKRAEYGASDVSERAWSEKSFDKFVKIVIEPCINDSADEGEESVTTADVRLLRNYFRTIYRDVEGLRSDIISIESKWRQTLDALRGSFSLDQLAGDRELFANWVREQISGSLYEHDLRNGLRNGFTLMKALVAMRRELKLEDAVQFHSLMADVAFQTAATAAENSARTAFHSMVNEYQVHSTLLRKEVSGRARRGELPVDMASWTRGFGQGWAWKGDEDDYVFALEVVNPFQKRELLSNIRRRVFPDSVDEFGAEAAGIARNAIASVHLLGQYDKKLLEAQHSGLMSTLLVELVRTWSLLTCDGRIKVIIDRSDTVNRLNEILQEMWDFAPVLCHLFIRDRASIEAVKVQDGSFQGAAVATAVGLLAAPWADEEKEKAHIIFEACLDFMVGADVMRLHTWRDWYAGVARLFEVADRLEEAEKALDWIAEINNYAGDDVRLAEVTAAQKELENRKLAAARTIEPNPTLGKLVSFLKETPPPLIEAKGKSRK